MKGYAFDLLFLVLNLFACASLELQVVGTAGKMALSWQYKFQMKNDVDTSLAWCKITVYS
jgi:hypothetical protein